METEISSHRNILKLDYYSLINSPFFPDALSEELIKARWKDGGS